MTAQQLKNSILQMAIQGKLIPQDPNDEPASVLLERIRAEKEQMTKDGKIKKEKASSIIFHGDNNLPYEKVGDNEPVCIADEVPFEIPDSWEWVRVKYFTTLYNGKAFKPSEWSDDGLPIVRIQNLNDCDASYNHYKGPVEPEYVLHGNELLFAWSGTPGTSFGAHIWQGRDAVLNQHIFKLEFNEKIIFKPYYMYALNQRVSVLISAAHGSAGLQHVTKGVFENTLIPLPPYSEQQRIVNRLEDLNPFVDEYDCQYERLESLNNNFPEQIKKSILQQAVQGKLVPQDPADEPASVLLERIRAEKEQMIKDGKIKKEKNPSIIFRGDDNLPYEKVGDSEPVCIADEVPFEIPDSWEWIHPEDIGFFSAGKTPKAMELSSHGKYPYFKVSDMNTIGNEKYLHFTENYLSETYHGKLFSANTIVFPKNGGAVFTNKKRIIETDSLVDLNTGTFTPYGFVDEEYLFLLFQTIDFTKYYKGTALPTVDLESVKKILWGLPPYAEQKRIVNSVARLTPFITKYETLETTL